MFIGQGRSYLKLLVLVLCFDNSFTVRSVLCYAQIVLLSGSSFLVNHRQITQLWGVRILTVLKLEYYISKWCKKDSYLP